MEKLAEYYAHNDPSYASWEKFKRTSESRGLRTAELDRIYTSKMVARKVAGFNSAGKPAREWAPAILESLRIESNKIRIDYGRDTLSGNILSLYADPYSRAIKWDDSSFTYLANYGEDCKCTITYAKMDSVDKIGPKTFYIPQFLKQSFSKTQHIDFIYISPFQITVTYRPSSKAALLADVYYIDDIYLTHNINYAMYALDYSLMSLKNYGEICGKYAEFIAKNESIGDLSSAILCKGGCYRQTLVLYEMMQSSFALEGLIEGEDYRLVPMYYSGDFTGHAFLFYELFHDDSTRDVAILDPMNKRSSHWTFNGAIPQEQHCFISIPFVYMNQDGKKGYLYRMITDKDQIITEGIDNTHFETYRTLFDVTLSDLEYMATTTDVYMVFVTEY